MEYRITQPQITTSTKIRLIGIGKSFIEVKEIIDVTRLGVHCAVRLREETNSDNWKKRNDLQSLYEGAQNRMKESHRNAKYRNDGAVLIYAVFIFGSLLIGFLSVQF